jgi:hypothetical protein
MVARMLAHSPAFLLDSRFDLVFHSLALPERSEAYLVYMA